MSLTIVEIMGRSEQGRTQPYICRGDDDETYFVKGRSATRKGLAAEWLCARLADTLGLPIAPYAIADVPEELVEPGATGWLSDLGSGPVFASRRINAVELTETHRDQIDEAICRDVAVFDWWVRNADRTMTVRGGNPNLLWNPSGTGSLVVLDHNMAFDPEFSPADFFEGHVFADSAHQVFTDFVARREYVSRLSAALGVWDSACAMIPAPWHYVDPEMTVPASLPIEEMFRVLNWMRDESFWSTAS